MSSPGGASEGKKQAATFKNMCVTALALSLEDAPSGVDDDKWKSITTLLHSLASALEHIVHGSDDSSVASPVAPSTPCPPSSLMSLSVPHTLSPFSSLPSVPSSDPTETFLRERSLVVAGLKEADESLNLDDRCESDRKGVARILGYLEVETMPVQVYRMGKRSDHPRLLKLVMPSRSFLLTALKNANKLRGNSEFQGIFIRKSMSKEERVKHGEMRACLKDLRAKDPSSKFVIYRGEIWHKDDIKSRVRKQLPNSGN